MEQLELRRQIEEKLAKKAELCDSQNLVELGLSSLQIMRLVNQWRKQGIRVQFGAVMELPTLENWWNLIQKGRGKGKLKKMGQSKAKAPFPLTDVQYAYKIGRGDDQELGGVGCHAYQEFDGREVDPERLKKAWKLLQYHHPMLRARFLENGLQEIMDKPYQETIDTYDLRAETDVEKRLLEIRASLSHRRLKVEEGQVAGIALSLLPDGKTRIHFDVDLLVADVQSFQILLRDLAAAYCGKELPQVSKEWNFGAYLEVQKGEEPEEKRAAQEYWQSRLEELPMGPELPLAKQPSAIEKTRFYRRDIKLEKQEWELLKQKAAQNHATPAMLLLAAYALVLEHWSSRKRFLINIPFFNRKTEYQGLEDVVADFTTLLLLEVDMRTQQTFLELLNQIQNQVHQDMKYTMYSGVQVQRDYMKLHGERHNIAPVVFACNLGTPLVNQEFTESLGEFTHMISQTPGVWMDFQTYEDEAGLMLTWDTVDELFPDGMIDDMMAAFESCLHQLGQKEWHQKLSILPLNQQEFIDAQKNSSVPDSFQCLHEEFIRNARKNPERIAIIDTGEDRTFTYGELEKEALSVAAFLGRQNILHQPVAISLTRGYKQIIAALGIILSGNFYVPVSLGQPKERRKLIHEMTGIRYVISDFDHLNLVTWPEDARVWPLETACGEAPLKEPVYIDPKDTAYIIMTSGTTGLPKGVEIYHQGAWNTITDVNKRFGITQNDAILSVSAMDFDLSVYDCFGMLSCGGRLILIPEEKNKDAKFWMEQILKYNITLWNSVPVLLDMLLIQAEAQNSKLPIKAVMLSGDWIGLDLPERTARQTAGECRFIAMGGATEASIWSNVIEVTLPIPKNWHSIPYGRPLSHQTYRIIDKKGQDVPFYVEGELWIGGIGVGTYRSDNELVQRKFVNDEYGRWYRTGDKGRFWPDGTIEFLGREDFQVKIRGHRIELGEIETALKAVPGIHNAIVEASDGKSGDKHLIAYLETGEIREQPLYIEALGSLQAADIRWRQIIQVTAEKSMETEFEQAVQYGDQKSCQAMLETMECLGLFQDLQEHKQEYDIEEIMNTGHITKAQKGTVVKWLHALTASGILTAEHGKYRRNVSQNDSAIVKSGEMAGIDSYINRLKPHLPDLLRGNKNPLEIFYTGNGELSPGALLEQLPGAEQTTKAVISQLKKIIAESERKIRILEIGTRNLNITRMILEALDTDNVEYVYTDSSLFFVNEAKSMTEQFPFARCQVLDLEETELEVDAAYDCIVAINSFHRMHDLQTACSNAVHLLNPAGLIILLEMTFPTYLQDITAAILEAGQCESGEAMIKGAQQWQELLMEHGFARVCSQPEDNMFCGRNLIVAMPKVEAVILDQEYVAQVLKEKLPEYMIPRVYFALPQLPLNKNGKIDRKALHKLDYKNVHYDSIEKPESKTEARLCEIWKQTFQSDEIGVQDNYYLLGGDSLIATQMLTKIRQEFGVEVSIKDVLGRKTVREQADRIDELSQQDSGPEGKEELPQIVPDPERENDAFHLTEVQQAYWIGRKGLYDLGQVSTHCYFELDCEDINLSQLQAAWNEMILYHGMMRAVIHPDGSQQIVKEVPVYHISSVNLEQYDEGGMQSELEKIRTEMSHQVIHTDTWPLFDVRAAVLKEGRTRIHISFDNLIFDGWSMFHLLSEWAQRYRNAQLQIPAIELSFRDYVLALDKIKESGAYERDKKYWLDRLEDFTSAPELPLQKKENEITDQRFCRRSAYLSGSEWDSLKHMAKRQGLTPSVLLITAYAEVLRRWSTNMDFALNLTQFNREPLHPQVNQLVGDFTTLTLLEVKISGEDSFAARARKVQAQLMEDLGHTCYSAVDLERELKKKQGNKKNSIMPIVFTSGLGVEQWNEGNWIGRLVYNVSQTPQVWLDHQVVESNGELGLFWDSVDELFYPGMLDEMFDAYQELLRNLAANQELINQNSKSLVNVPISAMRCKANQTAKEFPDQSLDELFLEMAAQYPDEIAVVNGDVRLTYREIREKALYLCRQLQEKGIRQEESAAVLMEKGWKQIISVYGILFSGAAYLPLDADNPAERLQKIMEDSKVKYILVDQKFYENNKWLTGSNCIVVDGAGRESQISVAKKNTDRLAYTIYTSGSTGVPKGVMITHKGAVNTILDINSRYAVGSQDAVLALSNLHFDLSVYDIFGVLAAGGKVVIPEHERIKDPEHWIQLMNQEEITIWNTVPAFMEMLMEYERSYELLTGKYLHLVLMSGDWIPVALPEKIYNFFDAVKVISLGGATEASIWSNSFETPERIPDQWDSIPYGKPLANQQYHILDEQLQECPDQVPGMLYISGQGVAKGYLNDTEKTREKFIYHQGIREVLYSTGDMGKYWPDGNIEFLGRKDNQVKLSGYRIETGEIEHALKRYPGIKSAIVEAVKVEGKYQLAAVVVTADEHSSGEVKVKSYLSQMLPAYMIPARVVFLTKIPLSSNGKIDRNQIKTIASAAMCKAKEQVKAEAILTKQQSLIKTMWETVLKHPDINPDEDFFELGGSSLQAIQLINMLNRQYEKNIGIEVIFDNPTVKQLADKISEILGDSERYNELSDTP